MEKQLSQSHTPPPVIRAIMNGFKDWIDPPSGRSRAPTYGSLHGPDVLLTSAYYEQYHQLGWFQLCLGRIGKLWSKAVSAYYANTCPKFDSGRWATSVIAIMWQFTKQLWLHRNQIIHGRTVDEAATNQMACLHDKVKFLYKQYEDNSSYVLPRHEYLFTQRPLDYRLAMSYDSITCWLRSVEEARLILDFQQQNLRETARTIFSLFCTTPSFTTLLIVTHLMIHQRQLRYHRPLMIQMTLIL
jgi:hypothetical protein